MLESRPQAIGLVYTDHLIIDESNTAAGVGHKATIPYSKENYITDFVTFHFRLFRRELFDQIGGLDESFTAAADYDFCLRMSGITEFAKVEKPLYAYRVHAQSISTSRRLEQIEMSARRRPPRPRAARARGVNRTRCGIPASHFPAPATAAGRARQPPSP